jgi:hypothetical protein
MSSTSFLSSIGLGGQSPAEAAKDAAALANEKTAAFKGLSTSMNQLNLALSTAKALGVPASSLSTVEKITKDGNMLISQAATLTPAQLIEKTTQFKLESESVMRSQSENDYTGGLAKMVAIQDKIRKRAEEIRDDKYADATIRSKYDALLEDVSKDVAIWTTQSPTKFYTDKETSGSAGSMAGTYYSLPITTTDTGYQDRLDILDIEKEAQDGSTPTFTRIYRRFKEWWKVYLYYSFYAVVIFASMILGGIITSNMYVEAEKDYLPARIFYFIYGAIGFPLSLIGGVIKPPFWVSGIFPFKPRTNPYGKQAGGFNTLQAASERVVGPLLEGNVINGKEAAAALSYVSTGVNTPKPVVNVAGIVNKAVSTAKTASPQPYVEDNKNPAPPTSTFDSLFSYVVVNTKDPAAYQKSAKNNLWYLSILFSGILSTFVGVNNTVF